MKKQTCKYPGCGGVGTIIDRSGGRCVQRRCPECNPGPPGVAQQVVVDFADYTNLRLGKVRSILVKEVVVMSEVLRDQSQTAQECVDAMLSGIDESAQS